MAMLNNQRVYIYIYPLVMGLYGIFCGLYNKNLMECDGIIIHLMGYTPW